MMTISKKWAVVAGACLLLLALLPACPARVFTTWFTHVGGDADEGAYAVAPTRDGGFVVAGFAESTFEEDDNALLMKIGPAGRVLWQSEFGDDREDCATAVAQTADGGFIVAGQFGSRLDPNSDAFLVKTDSKGQEQWRRLFDSGGHDTAVSVEQTSDGGYLVGLELDLLGDAKAAMAKTGSDGAPQWQVDAGICTHVGRAMATADGGFALAWWDFGPVVKKEDRSRGRVGILKTGADGTETWRQAHQDVAIDVKDMRGTPDGGFVLVGQYDLLGADSQILLWKADAAGEIEWKQSFGRGLRDVARAVRTTRDGGYIVVGTIQPERKRSDIYLAKVDANGNVRWERGFGGDDFDEGYDVIELDNGFVLVGLGESFEADGELENRQAVVARLDADGHCRSNEVALPEPPAVKPDHYDMLSFVAQSHTLTPDPQDHTKYEVALLDVAANTSVHRVMAPPEAPQVVYLDPADKMVLPPSGPPQHSDAVTFRGNLWPVQDFPSLWDDLGFNRNAPEAALLMTYSGTDPQMLYLRLGNPRYDADGGRLLFEGTRIDRPTAPELLLVDEGRIVDPTKVDHPTYLFVAEGNGFVEVDDASFQTEVLESGVPVVLFFTADWCGPCRTMSNILLELAAEMPGVKFCSIDVDNNPTVCQYYGIRGIPVTLVFKNQNAMGRMNGPAPKGRVRDFINAWLN